DRDRLGRPHGRTISQRRLQRRESHETHESIGARCKMAGGLRWRRPSGLKVFRAFRGESMTSTEVRVVRTRADFHRFIDYAYEINARDPHGIPPLRMSERERLTPRKNPFFAHADVGLLLAWRGREVVGRVGAIDDRLHNQTHAENLAMFGFFEAADG